MRVSLIFTVLNEARSLSRLMDSILAQTRAPDEIVVVDGGSTDDTLARLQEYAARVPLKILSVPGANISQGRNAAIHAASHDLICSTDAGVRLDERWVEELIKPFENDATLDIGRRKNENTSSSFIPHLSSLSVVSGFFLPDPHGVFETALAATTLPMAHDIDPHKFLPSSRSVAFTKAAWQAVNGYPEWLDYCEDLIFDFALRAKNFRFAFAPNARVYFRPRSTLRAFFKQYYHYARGDGKSNLWFKRHVIRYATYFVAFPFSLALLFSPFWLLGFGFLGVGFFVMFFKHYQHLFLLTKNYSLNERVRAALWVPVIRVTGDIAKMIGYPAGVLWRMKNYPRIHANPS